MAVSERSKVAQALVQTPNTLANDMVNIMTMFGASESWSGADMLEAIAEILNRLAKLHGLPVVADQPEEALQFWRTIADEIGIEHDGEDN